MDKPLLFKSLYSYANGSRKGLGFLLSFFFFLFIPFLCFAQFPYNESFKNATAPGVIFGGAPTAFLTADPAYNIDAPGSGYLRLTNADLSQKAFIYSNNVFLGTYGLNISFEYYSYGGTGGADGICFFLFDAATTTFNIGGYGGSLGYAQLNGNVPGVSNGYLGIGLDEYGNFSNPTEDRQGPGSFLPNGVVLRGAGNGSYTVSTNYTHLTTVQTTSLSPMFNIAGDSRTATSPGIAGYRKVFINLTPGPSGGLVINVSIQHDGTAAPVPVIVNQPYNQPIPAKGLKYGDRKSVV